MTQALLPLKKVAERSVWIANHVSYVKRFFRPGQTFTNDKLHDIFGKPPHPNYWGVLTANLSEEGFIREIGRVASKRDKANGRKITVWEVVK